MTWSITEYATCGTLKQMGLQQQKTPGANPVSKEQETGYSLHRISKTGNKKTGKTLPDLMSLNLQMAGSKSDINNMKA